MVIRSDMYVCVQGSLNTRAIKQNSGTANELKQNSGTGNDINQNLGSGNDINKAQPQDVLNDVVEDPLSYGDISTSNVIYHNDLPASVKEYRNYKYISEYSGKTHYYYSFDNTRALLEFKSLGISLILSIFSFYLYYVATKLYREYFDKEKKEEIWNYGFYILSLLIVIIWVGIIIKSKDLIPDFILNEIINYPNQFVLGLVISSLLLFGIGIFRFIVVAFIQHAEDQIRLVKDIRFSFVGLMFGLLSILADLIALWSIFR
ncbi:MAG: hypothetical protein IPO86_10135 [Saprospiraceae bacterium]|nr:hypothetical protein [Saprospiraceae bacterium]